MKTMILSTAVSVAIRRTELKTDLPEDARLLPNHCLLCPRACGANRQAGQRGVCGADDTLRIARAALHTWEEPPISVGAGSGAVFFSNCPLRCIYCQNAEIACGEQGIAIPLSRLVDIFFELKKQGAANINLVTPTHYLPLVREAIVRANERGLHLPIICNTSGYETISSVRDMADWVDVFLTDFKYWRARESDASTRYSNAPDYFDVTSSALVAMVDAIGTPIYDEMCASSSSTAILEGENRLIKGVVVRHLILPGRLDDSKHVIEWIWNTFGNDVLYSVMNQYTPMRAFPEATELNERVSDEEYDRLLDYMDSLGIDDYFWQEGGAAQESFIPAFDSTGVLSSDDSAE